jgi:hypothetical protein
LPARQNVFSKTVMSQAQRHAVNEGVRLSHWSFHTAVSKADFHSTVPGILGVGRMPGLRRGFVGAG